jgi:hypothetical protein
MIEIPFLIFAKPTSHVQNRGISWRFQSSAFSKIATFASPFRKADA